MKERDINKMARNLWACYLAKTKVLYRSKHVND